MKRMISIWLAMALLLSLALSSAMAGEVEPSLGGRTEAQLYEELIVGTTASFSGNFFGDMWGGNASDIDVRTLLHAYSLTDWKAEDSAFAVNQTVVSGLISEVDDEGNRLYFVSLVDGLKYSDGSPITAADYVFSLLLAASKELGALGAMTSRLAYLDGAAAYSAGEKDVFTGVRLYGEKNFSVTIQAEYLPFFYELGLLSVNPYPIHVIAPGCEVADDGEGAYIRNIDQKKTQPVFTTALLEKTLMDTKNGYMSYPKVTSGAYKLTAYDAASKVVKFEINEHFIGDQEGRKPTIKRLMYQVIPQNELFTRLRDGSVDLVNKCTQASVIQEGMEMRANVDGFTLQQYMRSGLGFISFNCEQGPAQFQAVRQALALCLDRDLFVSEQVESYGDKVNGYYGMGQWMTQLVNGTLTAPLPELSENPTAAEQAAYDEAVAAWDALTLENLNDYALDLEAAEKLLVEDGWVYNEEGQPFNPAADAVRAKQVETDGSTELMLLDMVLILPEEGGTAEKFRTMQENMEKVGAKLTIEQRPYHEMLERYYRQVSRENDMFFLGTNFNMIFDPSATYSIYEEDQGGRNTSGLRDERLMELALDLNKTEAGDVLGYVEKWLAFQEYWNEILPGIPVYSNVYFDFYTDRLQDYYINQHITWGEAILSARLSDVEVAQEADADADADAQTDADTEDGFFGATPIDGTPIEGGLILP